MTLLNLLFTHLHRLLLHATENYAKLRTHLSNDSETFVPKCVLPFFRTAIEDLVDESKSKSSSPSSSRSLSPLLLSRLLVSLRLLAVLSFKQSRNRQVTSTKHTSEVSSVLDLLPFSGRLRPLLLAALFKLHVNIEGGFGDEWKATHVSLASSLELQRLSLLKMTAKQQQPAMYRQFLGCTIAGADAVPVNRSSRAFELCRKAFETAEDKEGAAAAAAAAAEEKEEEAEDKGKKKKNMGSDQSTKSKAAMSRGGMTAAAAAADDAAPRKTATQAYQTAYPAHVDLRGLLAQTAADVEAGGGGGAPQQQTPSRRNSGLRAAAAPAAKDTADEKGGAWQDERREKIEERRESQQHLSESKQQTRTEAKGGGAVGVGVAPPRRSGSAVLSDDDYDFPSAHSSSSDTAARAPVAESKTTTTARSREPDPWLSPRPWATTTTTTTTGKGVEQQLRAASKAGDDDDVVGRGGCGGGGSGDDVCDADADVERSNSDDYSYYDYDKDAGGGRQGSGLRAPSNTFDFAGLQLDELDAQLLGELGRGPPPLKFVCELSGEIMREPIKCPFCKPPRYYDRHSLIMLRWEEVDGHPKNFWPGTKQMINDSAEKATVDETLLNEIQQWRMRF